MSTSHSSICEVCGARSATLRRGRCWICYVRWSDARPVGQGASCVVCNERRTANLRMVEFQGRWKPMCHNCASKTLQLMPMPRTIDGVRERLTRDRRWNERRHEKKDHRIFAIERRSAERRNDGRDDEDWVDAEDFIIEVIEMEESGGEATRIAASEDPI